MREDISLAFSREEYQETVRFFAKDFIIVSILVATYTTNNRHACSALFLIYKVFVNLDRYFVNKNSLAIYD